MIRKAAEVQKRTGRRGKE